MTAPVGTGPADPFPTLAEVGRALEKIAKQTAHTADLIARWEAGDFAVGQELVQIAGP